MSSFFYRRNNANVTGSGKKIAIVVGIIIIFICVLAVLIIINKEKIFKKDTITDETGRTWKIKEVYLDDTISAEVATLKHWEEKSITEKYYDFDYRNNLYVAFRETKIPSDNIGKKLGEILLKGYDSYTNQSYNINAGVYEVINFPTDCILAVQFEGDANYYLYSNMYYKPDTLEELLDDLNLRDIASFGDVYYSYDYIDSNGDKQYAEVVFYDIKDEDIWEKIFDDTNLKNVYKQTENYNSNSESISIRIDIPFLGIENKSITLSDEGYLITNIFDTGKAFLIGKEKVQNFIDYISSNYDGYRIVYVDKMENESIENTDGGKIMVTTNTANGYYTEEANVSSGNNNLVSNNEVLGNSAKN